MSGNLFVSGRSFIVRSARYGQSVELIKGVPTWVPKVLQSEVMEKGGLPVDETGAALEPEKFEAEAAVGPKVVLAPEDADERKTRITEVMKAIVQRNDSKDFTGGGQPSKIAVTAALGWRVDQKEIKAIWEADRESFKGLNG